MYIQGSTACLSPLMYTSHRYKVLETSSKFFFHVPLSWCFCMKLIMRLLKSEQLKKKKKSNISNRFPNESVWANSNLVILNSKVIAYIAYRCSLPSHWYKIAGKSSLVWNVFRGHRKDIYRNKFLLHSKYLFSPFLLSPYFPLL